MDFLHLLWSPRKAEFDGFAGARRSVGVVVANDRDDAGVQASGSAERLTEFAGSRAPVFARAASHRPYPHGVMQTLRSGRPERK